MRTFRLALRLVAWVCCSAPVPALLSATAARAQSFATRDECCVVSSDVGSSDTLNEELPDNLTANSTSMLLPDLAQPDASPTPSTSPAGTDPLAVPLTAHEKFTLFIHRSFGPPGFVIPAGEAAVGMANPPGRLPREWKDGGGAYGRQYGSFFTRHVAGNAAEYTVSTMLHHDPRYFPSESSNAGRRALHAFLFAFVNKTDSGRRTIAFGNFAGATAAGFVTMAYQPPGFNDITHGGQRAEVDFSTYVGRNLIAEFSPQLNRVARKLHFSVPNNDHPLWWSSY